MGCEKVFDRIKLKEFYSENVLIYRKKGALKLLFHIFIKNNLSAQCEEVDMLRVKPVRTAEDEHRFLDMESEH